GIGSDASVSGTGEEFRILKIVRQRLKMPEGVLHVAKTAGGLDQLKSATFLDRDLERESPAMIVGKLLRRQTYLLELAQTFDLLRPSLGLAQHRQEQHCEDGDDDDHQQHFQQRERATRAT